MPENMTMEGLMLTVGIILAAMNLYNVFATARKNAREEKKRQAEPTVTLEGEITGIAFEHATSGERRLKITTRRTT